MLWSVCALPSSPRPERIVGPVGLRLLQDAQSYYVMRRAARSSDIVPGSGTDVASYLLAMVISAAPISAIAECHAGKNICHHVLLELFGAEVAKR